MNPINLDFAKTALVLIDLQQGIVRMTNGQEVVANAAQLVRLFREKGGFISFVNVNFLDGKDSLKPATDNMPAARGAMPDDWAVFVPELAVGAGDHVVTKRQWGAFFGTDLDLQLRRRGIDTIVLGGISTNIGVETTAREAFQLGYNQVFVTDAMKASSAEEHDATVRFIFPKIGKLRTTAEVLAGC